MIVRKVRARAFEQKDKFRCMFCGGGQCKRCGPTAYLNCENPVIRELHSNWITNNILAMARPTNLNDEMLQDFVDNGITNVFNLTMPGEHPFCGRKDGLIASSGFTYNPELFMSRGINHFNYCWPDMTIPTVNQALQVVQIALSEISKGGKIAVHCHAGYGRTGIIIACVLIAKDGVAAKEAIAYVRSRRPGSIQTSSQVDFVHAFERYYTELLNVYYTPDLYTSLGIAIANKSIAQCILDQEHTLLSLEKYELRYMHKSVVILHRILLYGIPKMFNACFLTFTGHHFEDIVNGKTDLPPPATSDDESLLYRLKIEANKSDWTGWTHLQKRSCSGDDMQCISSASGNTSDARESSLNERELAVATQLLVDWFGDRTDPLVSDDLVLEVAPHINTAAAAALSPTYDAAGAGGSFIDTRDFAMLCNSLSAASAKLAIEDVLSRRMKRYNYIACFIALPTLRDFECRHQLQLLYTVVSLLQCFRSSAPEPCSPCGDSCEVLKKMRQSALDCLSIRAAIMCSSADKAHPALISNKYFNISTTCISNACLPIGLI